MIEAISNIISKATEEKDFKITVPDNSKHGHYSTNLAMVRAGMKQNDPGKEAAEIKQAILRTAPEGFFEKIEIISPGFINFFISKKTLVEEVNLALNKKNRYGSSAIGKGKKIIVDYSAPNIAKPMSVGHLRSTVIGEAIINLLRFQGYKVIGDNHIGDWGTQFGAIIYAYKNWSDKEKFAKNAVEHLVSLYVKFHKESENNKDLINLAKEETAKLQKGDKKNIKLWKLFVKESLKEFNKVYNRLGVKFDVILGESFYQPMLKETVKEALNKGVALKDEGAVKIFFNNDNLPPYVIEKSDGSHLYTTTDLAALKYRINKWKPVKILYVVANEQALHFAQLFEAAKMMGFSSSVELQHIKFGMMLGESGKKFSTRKGDFIKLEELLGRAKKIASEINPLSSEEVGVGAIKYYDLSHQRMTDIIFDWNRALNLKGNSAPYIQYTYARLASILKKAGGVKPKLTEKAVMSETEIKVLEAITRFPDVVAYAASKYEANHLAEYLFKAANVLNIFYENIPVLSVKKENIELASSRLAIVCAGMIVLKNGLKLLGIKLPKRM